MINYSENRWGIPKGKIDGAESSKEAALREVLEETSLDIKKIGLEISDQPIDILKYMSLGEKKVVYVYKVDDEFGVLQGKPLKCTTMINGTKYPENDKFIWASKEQARSLIYRSQIPLLNHF